MRPSKSVSSFAPPRQEKTDFRPQLTSLIDVMTFLLVFLIKSFSVQGDIVTPAANLNLPVSSSQLPPRPSLSIEVTRTDVIAEGKLLASLSSVSGSDAMLLPGLYRWTAERRTHISAAQQNEPILIQADRETEYSVLKRVMYSCSKAGFINFTILAVQKE